MPVPLISICLPNLDKCPFLEARMESLLAQTFRDWELLVCDSHSTDGSWEFLQKFSGDPRIRLHQIPRRGVYPGINDAIHRARGQWINIATSDDTCSPRMLERLAALLERHPDAAIALCDHTCIDREGRPIPNPYAKRREFYGDWMERPHRRPGQSEFLLHAAYGTTWVTLHAALFRRTLFDRIGGFRTHPVAVGDEDWSLRACLATDVLYLPDPLVTWRLYDGQATAYVEGPALARARLADLIRVLRENRPALPKGWTQQPDWEDALTALRRSTYRESLALHRPALRTRPTDTLRGIPHAVRHDPVFLLRQIANGLRPGPELTLSCAEFTHRILQQFDAPWPPVPIQDPSAHHSAGPHQHS